MAGTKARSHRGATRAPSRGGPPAWVLLAAGFAGGCFFSFLVYLGSLQPAETKPPASAAKGRAAEENAPTASTQFDFFTLLPEREVIVPAEPATESTAKAPEPIEYILQAGSFRRQADADRRRAQILLLGLDAKVDAVQANGDTWHRVYVGPITTRSQLANARSKLISEGIETLVLKRKPK